MGPGELLSALHRLALPVALGLLGVLAVIIALGAVADVAGRNGAPDRVVQRYFASLEEGDDVAALDQIAPANRARWADFVENGVLNEYRITGIAVRSRPLYAALARQPQDVTVFLDITQWTDGTRWQAAPRVPLVQSDGRWYLERPPLAPAG